MDWRYFCNLVSHEPPRSAIAIEKGALPSEEHAVFTFLYDAELNAMSYRKLRVDVDGTVTVETAPEHYLLHSFTYRFWKLEDAKKRKVYIAYDPKATKENAWWATLRGNLPFAPRLNGPFVLLRLNDALQWTSDHAFVQIGAWLNDRYGKGEKHNFSAL